MLVIPLVTEIEIPDDEGAPASERSSPYRNLFVPLVVVPAMIGMVFVLVWVLFGAITGEADSPAENLETVLHGGRNERRQAAFSLATQILEYQHAKHEGRATEWEIDETFLPQLRNARAQISAPQEPGELAIPFVLSSVMALVGDPEGVQQLIEMTRLSASVDPKGEFRWKAVIVLGSIGGELAEPERLAAAKTLIGLLESDDAGIALAAASGLQNLPGPATIPGLKGCLGDRSVELRLQAALSLVRLGDVSGAEVLRAMIHPEPYLAEHQMQPEKWAPQRISESRRKAIAALLEIREPPSRELLERWAEDDPDPSIRDLARRLLSGASQEQETG